MEAAEKNAKALKGNKVIERKFFLPPPPAKKNPCNHCDKISHDEKNCKFREADCHLCGRREHISTVCQSKKKSSSRRAQSPASYHQKKRHRQMNRVAT